MSPQASSTSSAVSLAQSTAAASASSTWSAASLPVSQAAASTGAGGGGPGPVSSIDEGNVALEELSVQEVAFLLEQNKIRKDGFVDNEVDGNMLTVMDTVEYFLEYDRDLKSAPIRLFLIKLAQYRERGVPGIRVSDIFIFFRLTYLH